MNEVVLQACLSRITSLDRACLPDRIVVQLHRPLDAEGEAPGIDIARRWISDRIVTPTSWLRNVLGKMLGRVPARQLTEETSYGALPPSRPTGSRP